MYVCMYVCMYSMLIKTISVCMYVCMYVVQSQQAVLPRLLQPLRPDSGEAIYQIEDLVSFRCCRREERGA